MNFKHACSLIVAVSLLAGCATRRPAPVVDRTKVDAPAAVVDPKLPTAPTPIAEELPKLHVVQKGETLIAVALQYGVDYRELAAWNNIENPNLIQVGQQLRVTAPPAASASSVVATPLALPGAPVARPLDGTTPTPAAPQEVKPASGLKTEPKAVKLPYSDQALADLEADARKAAGNGNAGAAAAPVAAPVPAKGDDEKLEWSWPVKGKVLAGYTESSKGIDIAGTLKSPVLAAADGKVMYSGTGIRGYGKLVILKHNSLFLSAYAHNNEIVVKEGQEVKRGQKIAEMGSSDTDQVKLHFEIRRQGKPVDPAKFLPAP